MHLRPYLYRILIGLPLVTLMCLPVAALAGKAPFFQFCDVKSENTVAGLQTSIDVFVYDPDGPLPDGITSIRVTGPGGFDHTLDSSDFYPYFQGFSKDFAGTPQVGEYTFVATDSEGKTATGYYYFKEHNPIPLPDPQYFAAIDSGDPSYPILTWGTVPYAGNLFYRVRVTDMSGNMVWDGGFTTETIQIPEIPNPYQDYQWWVEVFDNHNFFIADNRAISAKVALNPTSTRPYFTYLGVYNRKDPAAGGGTTIGYVLEAGFDDPRGVSGNFFKSFSVTGPNNFLETFSDDEFWTESWGSYFWKKEPGTLTSGIYQFTLIDDEDNEIVSYDYVATNPMPPLNRNSMQVVEDQGRLILSWAAPEQIDRNVYYRVRIYDDTNATVHSSRRFSSSSYEVDGNFLQPGYRWQLRALDDSNWGHFSNQYRDTVEITSALDNERPFFRYAAVYKRLDDMGYTTTVDIQVEDPDGMVPDTIQSIRVQGPNGLDETLTSADYLPYWHTFFKRFPIKPNTTGKYTITVTDTNNNSATTYEYFEVVPDFPAVDEKTIQVSGQPNAPVVSWQGISGYSDHLYYRIVVADKLGNDVYRSSRHPATAHWIPSGYIQPGEFYQVRVETHDHRYWVSYSSRTNSKWVPLAKPAALPGVMLLLMEE